MSLLSSHLLTSQDGGTVHAFHGDDGLIYRACSGERCVYCNDMETARAHLSYWGRTPARGARQHITPAALT